MKPENHLVPSMPAPIGVTATDWKRGQADANADRPPDRSGSAAYWKGYIAACFKDYRHG
ncbi:hypothetical protein ABMY26_06275 (plasmid) [Azospirillum sp. HJ39]|uniref:hypothetical protein n=1 Tax=Azospirillum sp. HJ39 TaxID=3159496 RepID=UPI003555D5AB